MLGVCGDGGEGGRGGGMSDKEVEFGGKGKEREKSNDSQTEISSSVNQIALKNASRPFILAWTLAQKSQNGFALPLFQQRRLTSTLFSSLSSIACMDVFIIHDPQSAYPSQSP